VESGCEGNGERNWELVRRSGKVYLTELGEGRLKFLNVRDEKKY